MKTHEGKGECGIYVIQSRLYPEKFYIGSATNFRRRKMKHISDIKLKKHHSPLLQRHANKYGVDDLNIHLWFCCLKDDLLALEQYCIDTLKPIWNICKVAGNTTGYKHTEKSREKISESLIGNKRSIGRAPWNKGLSGYIVGPASEERKVKASNSNKGKQKGEKHPNWGKHLREETRKKISEANMSHNVSRETRDKISRKLTGVSPSEETKKKISKSLRNRKKKPFTDEHKRKLSIARRKRNENISTSRISA